MAYGDPVADGRVLGYQLDVSRCKVPTMPTLRRIVDILASLGYNQFQLYTEHTFAYSRHETAWRGASPMTPDEVRALDAYCAAKGIELVPNQNSFGHLERWLCHPEYNGLAELTAAGRKLYFFSRSSATDRRERMEVDFPLAKSKLAKKDNIRPVEVKSGKNTTHRSLDKFRSKYADWLDSPYLLWDKDLKVKDGITYLPLYMAPLI